MGGAQDRQRVSKVGATPVHRHLPSVGVITMVRDEADLLPRWVAHYGHHVGVENLFVFDDNSEDGSTDDLPCTVHRLPDLGGTRHHEQMRMRLVSGMAGGLLACYDAVILADADEFLVPDPNQYPSLVDFVAAYPDRPVIAPMTLNVVHHPAVEGPLDPTRPVLGQRRFAKFVPRMCKPSLKRIPAPWRQASHAIRSPFEISPDLFMIHLKFHDRDRLKARSNDRRRMFDRDGRGRRSNWRVGGDAISAGLDRFVAGADVESIPEFDARMVEEGIVREIAHGFFQASGTAQLQAMERQQLVRIPERLFGTV